MVEAVISGVSPKRIKNIIRLGFQCTSGRQNRMGCSKARRLLKDTGFRRNCTNKIAHHFSPITDHDGNFAAARISCNFKNMMQHRCSCYRVHDFGNGRTHARSLTGCQDLKLDRIWTSCVPTNDSNILHSAHIANPAKIEHPCEPAVCKPNSEKQQSLKFQTSHALAYLVLFIAPAFFTTNVVFGRMALSVEPFTLAFLRWSIASAILLAFCKSDWPRMITVFRARPMLCLFSGFLAFWVCGGVVYYALHHTTASNGVLIYTTPPILILAIEAIWRGRAISAREILGIIVALAGAATIILRGELENLLAVKFNTGDLLFVFAAVSWAIYSVLLRSKTLSALTTLPLLALLAVCGSVLLLPFAAYEVIAFGHYPDTREEWTLIAAIVVFSSLLSFLTFQYGVEILGSSIAGIFMYLLPPWGLFFAWFFLGETLEGFHVSGTILIMSGIVIATLPLGLLKS